MITLEDFRCRCCAKLLAKLSLDGESWVEIKCPTCNAMNALGTELTMTRKYVKPAVTAFVIK